MFKKVVFICLLSLSMCLSRSDGLQATPSTNATTTANSTVPVPPSTTKEAVVVPHPEAPATVPVPASTQATNTTAAPTNTTVPATNKTDADANKTTDKKEPAKKEEIPEVKPAAKNETVTPPTADKKENATVPAENSKKNETTTEKPVVTTKPTEAPRATDVPLQAARGFDGPSFIGGIILTIGLLAIGFMGFKYYKNQTERNYHTL